MITVPDSVKRHHPIRYPNLKAEIGRQDLRLADLAPDVGCAAQTVSHILRGRVRPSKELRQRFADRLGVDVEVLFAESSIEVAS